MGHRGKPETWRQDEQGHTCDTCGSKTCLGGERGCYAENVWCNLDNPGMYRCGNCMVGEDKVALFGHFEEEDCVPPIGVLGIQRSGTRMMTELLMSVGVWMGHKREDPHAQSIAAYVLPGSPLEVKYENADRAVRSKGPGFLDMHRRPFPWGWKYPSHHLGMNGWLDLCPDGRFVLLWRDEEPWFASMKATGTGAEAFIRGAGEKYRESVWRFKDHPQVHLIHYDEFVANPKEGVGRLGEFLAPLVQMPEEAYRQITTDRGDGSNRLDPRNK